MCVACIYSQAEVSRRVWVGEGSHLGQSVLDQLEAVLHGGRPYPAPVRPQRVCEGQENVGRRRDEPPVEIHHAQEGLQLLLVSRGWELLNGLHVAQDRRRPFGGDVMA